MGKEKPVQRVGRRDLGASFLLLEGICRSSDFHPCWSQSNSNISVLLASKRVAGPHWWHLHQKWEGNAARRLSSEKSGYHLRRG